MLLQFKRFIHRYLSQRNRTITHVRWYDLEQWGGMQIDDVTRPMAEETLETLEDFFQTIDPLYADLSIPEPLQIAGGWRDILEKEMPNTLRAIRTKDWGTYKSLLENMFRNEIVYGLWNFGYFGGSEIPPDDFLSSLDGYRFVTDESIDSLFCSSFGNPWGIATKAGRLAMIAGEAGIKAFNIVNLIRGSAAPVVVDLGSGCGQDMMQLAHKWKKSIRIICCDIPVTLATAYAQVAENFRGKIILTKDRESVRQVLSSPVQGVEFLFMPTIFVDELAGIDIDVVHNHGSLGEMDEITISYYLETLITKRTRFFIEENTARPETWGTFVEKDCRTFPVPASHRLVSRTPLFLAAKGHRYLQSLYVRTDDPFAGVA